MSTSEYFDKICGIVILIALIITVLFMNGEMLGLKVLVDEDSETHESNQYFTQNDRNGNWDTKGAAEIFLQGSSALIKGNGAYMKDGDLVIASTGRYIIEGVLEGGSVIVNAELNSKVWILFSGTDIYCPDNACLRVEQADKVFLTLKEGTENRLESGSVYSEKAVKGGTDGVIFARDDLTVNGSGSLEISGGNRHGIAANDDLVIAGGVIRIDAPDDALHANDRINIADSDLTLHAGDKGIVADKQDGSIYFESGALKISSCDDGLHAGGSILISGGSLMIDSEDDAVHSDTEFRLTDGILQITRAQEGIEAPRITVEGGELSISCRDDGLNAYGKSDTLGAYLGNLGIDIRKPPSEPDPELPTVNISGGKITIINGLGANADGIDSNGNILISGGEILISLIGNGINSAMDYGKENGGILKIDGGTVIAAASAASVEEISSFSGQATLLYLQENPELSNSVITLFDPDGRIILAHAVPLSYTALLLSCPEMKTGMTYTLDVNGRREEITVTGSSGIYGPLSGSSKQP